MRMEYLAAEAVLIEAEEAALRSEDFDTLGRLYFPLQEARRQRRQTCGDGTVQLDLWATGAQDALNAGEIVAQCPNGQLLIAGWGSIEPAVRLRELAWQRQLYVETFLGAVYPATRDGPQRLIAIIPTPDVALPPPDTAPDEGVEELIRRLPPFSIVLADNDLPRGPNRGSAQTFAMTMGLWERLHLPFLSSAGRTADPLRRIEAYRQCIRVDYACEKAHQWLAQTALELARFRAGAA